MALFTFDCAAMTFHMFIDKLGQKPDWQDPTMNSILQYMGKAFDDVKKDMSPSLADELASHSRKNLRLMTPTIALDISKCPTYQKLEKTSSEGKKNVSFPEWFFLASVYHPDHSKLRPYRDYDDDQSILFHAVTKTEQKKGPSVRAPRPFGRLREFVTPDDHAPDMSEPSAADASDGDTENEDKTMTDADDNKAGADDYLAVAHELSILLDRSDYFIQDGGQQMEELKDQIKDIQNRIAALEASKDAQELANAKRDEKLEELKKLVNESRDIMKLQAEKIDTLSEDLAKHLASPPH
ncbi:hypothetical protein FAVG1_00374 [Fusarium avenaceum]|nr:hypothetical protein FAVG1_00374 [Fusarium avenaceum]